MRPIGLLAGLLLLLGQLAAGLAAASPAPSRSAASALEAATVICHAGAADQAPAHRHDGGVLCSLCCVLAHAAAVSPSVQGVPAPRRSDLGLATRGPGARAPPAQVPAAAYPRGPPSLA